LTKEELRKLFVEKRLALSAEEYATLNRRLCENFFLHVGLSAISVLHIFLPLVQKKEPDTWPILNRILKDFPNIQISIPRVNHQEQRLDNIYFENAELLSTSRWGLQELKDGTATPIEKIDMVLVPLLTFDFAGHRVGYGKGYYDRLLAACRADCVKIGISLFPPVNIIDAVNVHDQRLNGCVTPDEFFSYT
jgi:5-formyltetrahydrofolate cyclo-ligase